MLWQYTLDELIELRKKFKDTFGLKLREEFHSSRMIIKPGSLSRIPKYKRLAMLGQFANKLGSIQDINIINVVINKNNKPQSYDVFRMLGLC